MPITIPQEEVPLLWAAEIDYYRGRLACYDEREAIDQFERIEVILQEDRAELWQAQPPGVKAPIVRAWHFAGYVGWTDGQYSIGRRGAFIMVQISGYRAHWAARRLPSGFVCRRLDPQITVWYDRDVEHLPRDHAARYLRGLGSRAHAAKPHMHQGFGAGDSLYIGPRGNTNGRMGRIYDKWRESGDDEYLNAIRYEVELTGSYADAAWATAQANGFTSMVVARIVIEHIRGMGLIIRWPDFGREFWRIGVQKPSKKGSDTMAWLSSQVAGAIHNMLGEGMSINDIADAIGRGLDRKRHAVSIKMVRDMVRELAAFDAYKPPLDEK